MFQHVAQILVVLDNLSELIGIVAFQLLVDNLKLVTHVLLGDDTFHCLVDNVAHRAKNVIHETLLFGVLDVLKVITEV